MRPIQRSFARRVMAVGDAAGLAKPTSGGGIYYALLSGEIACGNCGSVMTGAARVRHKKTESGKRSYEYPGYVCSRGVKLGGCRQIALPRDALESAVLGLLNEQVFSDACRSRLESSVRRALQKGTSETEGGRLRRLGKREQELAGQVAEAARRMLTVPESVIPEAESAVVAMKAELEGVRAALSEEKNRSRKNVDVERAVRECLAEVNSLEEVLTDPTVPLERRRNALAQLLRPENGQRPIVAEFEFDKGRGWRKSLKRVTVTHLSLYQETVAPLMVAGTVTAARCQPAAPWESGALWIADQALCDLVLADLGG